MVRDQATELRNLVQRAGRPAFAGPIPTMVSVVGGKGGSGVTTVAVQLAAGLVDLGLRIALADANLERPGVAPRCGLVERTLTKGSLLDVLSARRDIHEILVSAAGGLQILPAAPARGELVQVPASACDRLLNQFRTLGRHVDALFADAGATPGELMKSLWQASDHVLLVTAPDDLAVMDTYALIKTVGPGRSTMLHLLVNRAVDDDHCQQVFLRLAQSCQRFLGLELNLAGWLPTDRALGSVRPAASPKPPATHVSAALEELAVKWQLILEKWAYNATKLG